MLSARPISYPFTVRDICLVTDGGGAIIMTTADRARSMKKPPVYVLGCGQSITHASITSMPDLTHTGAIESGRQAYAMAGMKVALDNLVRVIQEQKRKFPEKALYVKGDNRTNYGTVRQVMEKLHQTGAEDIMLGTDEMKQAQPQ